jgi:hypothetical protein
MSEVAVICRQPEHLHGLLRAMDAVMDVMASHVQLTAPVRDKGKTADATGMWMPNSTRVVHRVAGLSKSTPPPDPFRSKEHGGRGTVRDEHRGKPGKERWREILLIDGKGHETSILIWGTGMGVIDPDHHDPVHAVRSQILLLRESLDPAMQSDRMPFAEDMAAYAACRILDEIEIDFRNRTQIGLVLPSILGPSGFVHGSISADDVREVDANLATIDRSGWPEALSVSNVKGDERESWTISRHVRLQTFASLDVMQRMRVRLNGEPTPETSS